MWRDDLPAVIEGCLGDGFGPGHGFDTMRQHLSLYAGDHFADWTEGNTSGHSHLAALLAAGLDALGNLDGPVVDLGGAVGRGAWEIAARVDGPVLSADFNISMLRLAQRLMRDGHAHYPRRRVGVVYDRCTVTLPEDRVEAASIDGAGFWRQLWHVTLPHLRTLILFVTLISIMDMYRVYDQVFVWTGNRFTDAHTLAVYNVRTATAFDIGRLGKGNAMSVLTVIGIFVVLIPFLYRSYKDQIAERT